MSSSDTDVVIEDRIEDTVRYVRFDIPKERAISILQRNKIINSCTDYNVHESVLLSNKYDGTMYLRPVTIYPAPAQQESDYDLENFLAEEQTNNTAVEFAFTGYTEQSETAEETNRDYIEECEACIHNLTDLFEENVQ